jgi:hypothetical protein
MYPRPKGEEMHDEIIDMVSKRIEELKAAGDGMANAVTNYISSCRCSREKRCYNCKLADKTFLAWVKAKRGIK